MKIIFSLLLLIVATQLSAQRTITYPGKTAIRKEHVKPVPETTDRPQWQDDRIYTLAGRNAIIDEAFRKVKSHLERCAGDVAFYAALCLNKADKLDKWCQCQNDRRCITGSWVFLRETQTDRPSFNVETTGCIRYVQVPALDELYAINYLAEDFHKDVLGPSGNESVTGEHEEFRSTIEIYPEVFERGARSGYYMELEKNTPEGPWAKSPVEAVEHLILHELGHLEYYIAMEKQSSNLKNMRRFNRHERMSRDDEEKFCDKFASSVWRCKSH